MPKTSRKPRARKLGKRVLKALTKMTPANIDRQNNIVAVVKQVLATIADKTVRASLNGPVTGLTFALDRSNGTVSVETVSQSIAGLNADEIRDVTVLVNLDAADASVEANVAAMVATKKVVAPVAVVPQA
jgi:hypothetical protein